MKFPSIQHIVYQTRRTTYRFPLVLAAAIIGGVASIYMTGQGFSRTPDSVNKLIFTAAIGIPLLFAFRLIAERRVLKGANALLWQTLGVILLAIYFFTLPENISRAPDQHFYRFFILLLAAHLLVAFAPYLQKNQLDGFWHFNKSLFLRFLVAVLFSGVLYIGLSVALLSIEQLFGVDIPGKRYGQLFLFIAWIFNTYFFLSGIPDDFNRLDKETAYPKGLKIFSQYVLIPIVLIYLVILYAYQIKILFEWNLPKGWTANLVLGFSIVGIFAYLLIYPIRSQPGNKWLHFFSRWYFAALIPPVIMLHLAIWRRIFDYGITVNRYVVLALAIWLTGIVLYFVVIRERNIKLIPISLFLIAMIAALGPASAFSLSEKSQVRRLRGYLERNHLLVDGQIHPASSPLSVPLAERGEISSIIRYLNDIHGLEAIRPWFDRLLKETEQDFTNGEKEVDFSPYGVVKLLGFTFVDPTTLEPPSYVNLISDPYKSLQITGYDICFPPLRVNSPRKYFFKAKKEKYVFENKKENSIIILYIDKDSERQTFDLHSLVKHLLTRYKSFGYSGIIPPNEMTITRITSTRKIMLYFTQINVSLEKDKFRINDAEVQVLVGKR